MGRWENDVERTTYRQFIEVPDGEEFSIRATNVRWEKTGFHARVGLFLGEKYLGHDTFNIGRREDRARLVKDAFGRLGDVSKVALPLVVMNEYLDGFSLQLEDIFSKRYMGARVYGKRMEAARKFLLRPYILTGGGSILFAPPGCISGDGVIEGPDGCYRVDELFHSQEQIRVWTLGPDGPVAALASPMFKKGTAPLYEFMLANGQTVKVASEHRFLTPTGWQYAKDATVGGQIAVASLSPQDSRCGVSLSVSPEGGQRSLRIDQDCQAHCSGDCHPSDAPPLFWTGTSLASAPSQSGAHEHSRACLHKDAPADESKRTHPYLTPAHRSMTGFVNQGEHDRVVSGTHSLRLPAERPDGRTCKMPLSARWSDQQTALLLPPSQGEHEPDDLSSLPPLASLSYSTIIGRSIIGSEDYYDLTVPVYQNYLANGIWHHNTGKSWLALCMALSVENGLSDIWPCERTTALYVNLERSEDSMRDRIAQAGETLAIHNPSLLMLNRRGASLNDVYESVLEMVLSNNVGLVVLDSLSRSGLGSMVFDDVSNKSMDLLNGLRCSWLAVGHAPRGDADHTYGSVMFDAAADLTLKLSAEQRENMLGLSLEVTKANDIPKPARQFIALEFEGDGEHSELIAIRNARSNEFPELEIAGKGKVSDDVVAYLRKGKATATEIARETGHNRVSVAKFLSKASDVARLGREGNEVFYGLKSY